MIVSEEGWVTELRRCCVGEGALDCGAAALRPNVTAPKRWLPQLLWRLRKAIERREKRGQKRWKRDI